MEATRANLSIEVKHETPCNASVRCRVRFNSWGIVLSGRHLQRQNGKENRSCAGRFKTNSNLSAGRSGVSAWANAVAIHQGER